MLQAVASSADCESFNKISGFTTSSEVFLSKMVFKVSFCCCAVFLWHAPYSKACGD